MHSVTEIGANVPAFLAKLWKLVTDSSTNDLICWSPTGTSFLIRNQSQFARELLPLYYKHNNMASFVRQLNMYGFHKVVSVESGGLKVEKDEMEFAHQYFLQGHPYLLDQIKRKIPTSKIEDGRVKSELVTKVLLDVKHMKGRQESLDGKLSSMKRENEALWRELALLRQKHIKQQTIINKLIQFLVTLVQPNRGLGIKRRCPLMLNDSAHQQAKIKKLDLDVDEESSEPISIPGSLRSPTGPVIHELEAETIVPDADFLVDPDSDTLNNVTDADENEILETAESDILPEGLLDTPHIQCPESPQVAGTHLDDEMCPLSPEILVTVDPKVVNPAIVVTKLAGKSNEGNGKGSTSNAPSNVELDAAATVLSPQTIELCNDIVPLLDATIVVPSASDPASRLTNEKASSPAPQVEEIVSQALVSNPILLPAELASSGKSTLNTSSKEKRKKQETVEPSTSTSHPENMSLAIMDDISREDFDDHLENMQTDLDNLRQMLHGEGYNIDASTLLGVCAPLLGLHDDTFTKLFNTDDVLPTVIPTLEGSDASSKSKSVSDAVGGNELISYNPSLFDLMDDDSQLLADNDPPLLIEGGNDSSRPAVLQLKTEHDYSDLNTPQALLLDPGFPTGKKRK